ncbi:MAG: nucleotide exchange factor GrpE [Flavobacteriales bacterium]|nr:nucleotide exchange factor GrpE [Flavobacteriales bacterium]
MGSTKEEELNAQWPTGSEQNEPMENGDNLNADTAENENESADPTESADPLEVLQEDYRALNDKYLRLYSDFENFRRRTAKERLDLLKSAGEDVFKILLPIVDDFERASKNMETATDVPSVKAGVELIHHKLVKELENKGLKPMQSMGEVFDSEIHEAITQIPAPSKDMKGKVVDVLEKGYFMNDKVIRFAKVVVGA